MKSLPVILLAASLLLPAPSRAAEPPAATLAQLEKALTRTSPENAGRPMRATTHAVVEKPGGGDREELLAESVGKGDGTAESRLVKATKDGKDVTAEKRAEQEKEKAKRAERQAKKPEGKKPEEKKSSLGLKIPTGDDRKLFTFGEAKSEGDLLVAPYEPVKGAKGDDLSRGRIAWNPSTGEPAWIEAQMVNLPTGLKEFRLRGEFADSGDAVYTRTLRTTGVGGLLWIKRRFDITVEMSPPAP